MYIPTTALPKNGAVTLLFPITRSHGARKGLKQRIFSRIREGGFAHTCKNEFSSLLLSPALLLFVAS